MSDAIKVLDEILGGVRAKPDKPPAGRVHRIGGDWPRQYDKRPKAHHETSRPERKMNAAKKRAQGMSKAIVDLLQAQPAGLSVAEIAEHMKCGATSVSTRLSYLKSCKRVALHITQAGNRWRAIVDVIPKDRSHKRADLPAALPATSLDPVRAIRTAGDGVLLVQGVTILNELPAVHVAAILAAYSSHVGGSSRGSAS